MFTRKVNASKPNSSGYVPGVIGSNRYTNANRAAQQVALAPAAPKKGFFGRLGNSLKSAFSRKPSANVQKLTAAPTAGAGAGTPSRFFTPRNAVAGTTVPLNLNQQNVNDPEYAAQLAAARASGGRKIVEPRSSAAQPASRGFFGTLRNRLGVPRGLTLRKKKEGNYSGFGRNVPETENAGESENPFGLSQGEGNAYEALNRAQGEGARRKRKTQKRKGLKRSNSRR
jgi:hypothetical protein